MPPTQPTSRRGTFVDMGTTNDIPDEPMELHLSSRDDETS